MTDDERYMWRCLQIARGGIYGARPNPMVGAVIVARGRIIGEGFHRRYGEAHAEVNAFASVSPADEPLLGESTLYVSLEPCAHWGKTPPCADLVARKGVRRCVVGCVDSFAKVSGRGIERIREAGIEVTVGVLEEECRRANRLFFTHNERRWPFITLKWAQTADHFIDKEGRQMAISSPLTQILAHKLRSEADAILVGQTTEEREHPLLTNRLWGGKSPQKIVFSSKTYGTTAPLHALTEQLHADGVQHLLVEGGLKTLQSFLDSRLFDEIRVETAPILAGKGTPAPCLPGGIHLVGQTVADGHTISFFIRKE